MDWETHKKQLLKDTEFVKALNEVEIEYQIARAVIEARIKRGLTQQDLAQKLHTTQSVVSRVESAKTTPTISFLKRIADALQVSLSVQFKA